MSWILPATALFPLLLAAVAALPGLRRYGLALLPLAPLPALVAGLWLPDGTECVLPGILMEAHWRMDTIARVFYLFTSISWLCAGLYAIPYFRGQKRQSSFVLPFLLAMSGNLLLPAAADVATFYTGFALMGLAAWGLIVHPGTPEALRAGRVYLFLVLLGEFLVLPALAQGALWADSPSMDAIRAQWILEPDPRGALALIAFGFGLKAGLFPLHVWLPLAHPAAPTPASAVLSGCMIKTGLLAWIRLLPLGTMPLPELGLLLAVSSAIGMIGGLLAAQVQTGAKALLAYTSLAKTGLMLLLLSLALIDPPLAPACIQTVLFLAAFHALHKTALFLGSSATLHPGRGGRILLPLLCASYAGVPFLAGAMTKDVIKAIPDPSRPGWVSALPLLLWIEALLIPGVLVRFARLTWPGTPTADHRKPGCGAVWTVSVLLAVLFPLILLGGSAIGHPVSLPAAKAFIYGDSGFWTGAALTLLMLAAGIRASHSVPPGDILNLLPSPSPGGRVRLDRMLKRAEYGLNQAPGGLAFLAVLLILLTLLASSVYGVL